MSANNMSGPQRVNKIIRYKPPSTDANPTLEDPTPDYMNLLGMIFSMCGLMLKLKWCAWIAVYCSFISFANSRSSEDTKQMMSSFITPSLCRRRGNQGPMAGGGLAGEGRFQTESGRQTPDSPTDHLGERERGMDGERKRWMERERERGMDGEKVMDGEREMDGDREGRGKKMDD
ncbi:unnamed protein product [Coregonus sp. 'balchen']|nr:unnamed protein product [Coregonus sp. 'balchen']